MKQLTTFLLAMALIVMPFVHADAGKKKDIVEAYPALAPYFTVPSGKVMSPDELGFIRRWLLLAHPIVLHTLSVSLPI